MEQKEELARRLLASGLSISQVSAQLRCSKPFIRRIRDQHNEQLGR
jgi:transposase-like protein